MKPSTDFSEEIKVIKISLTLPISNASNERFFSALKHVKTYIRSKIGKELPKRENYDLPTAFNIFEKLPTDFSEEIKL